MAKTQDDATNLDPPPLSRFVEADSVGVPNGLNHHVGAGNESINNVDPSGSVRDATGLGPAASLGDALQATQKGHDVLKSFIQGEVTGLEPTDPGHRIEPSGSKTPE